MRPVRRWAAWLALASLAGPAWVLLGPDEPGGSFDDPTKVGYYLATALVQAVCVAAGVGALAAARAVTPGWLGAATVICAIAGMLGSGSLLWVLLGLCGPTVLWGGAAREPRTARVAGFYRAGP